MTSDELLREVGYARRAVVAEMNEAARRGDLRTNEQMPSWVRYVAAEQAVERRVRELLGEAVA